MEFERHTFQRMRPVAPHRQRYGELFDGEDRAHRRFNLGLSASLRPCPTRETASTVSRMTTPGIADTYHCVRSTERPVPMRLPQDGTFGSYRLRNANALSRRIAVAMMTLA